MRLLAKMLGIDLAGLLRLVYDLIVASGMAVAKAR